MAVICRGFQDYARSTPRLSRICEPTDAALRTIRIHALQVYGDEIAPYPLLVVRPDGIETYAAARKAMQTWDDQFGYELIESEKEIAFPTKDPQLLERVEGNCGSDQPAEKNIFCNHR